MSLPVADPLASMTGALVDANDRLLGLISLTEVAGESLDEATAVRALLASTMPLLDADAAELVAATSHRVGTPTQDPSAHRVEVIRHDGDQQLTLRVWRRNAPFGTPERKLLDGVANLLTNAVRTARMHQTGLRQAVVEREHAAAARLTAAVLPDPLDSPKRSSIDTFARLTPARLTGGDLYAWDLIDGDLWFAVGDVSGKGLPAAVQMTTIMSALTGGLARHHQRGVGAVFEFVERMVFGNLSDAGMFVTLAVGRVLAHPTPNSDFTVEIANAGHSPVVFCSGGLTRRVAASAPPVGVLLNQLPVVEVLEVSAPAALVLATDGFTEQEDAQGQAFGEDEFDQLIAAATSTDSTAFDATALGEHLFEQLHAHSGDCEQSDDRTLVAVTFAP